ncbi:YncE family protein [Nonomuraea sp. NEAU-A123]|uniref:YncE family protein n=1 Tax=Nonomuraea sp. NEAU-A123 TaxID=2839649 RepID=UPI001BE43B63|nr:YncE family protein [Nonomuraea sp. NEAU-A123]MBT2229767.1 YncE family protein [Nonomuraea sp. NEAU-A123]
MFTGLIRMGCSRRHERRRGVRPSGMRRLAVGSAIAVLLLPSAVPGPSAAAAPLVEFAYVTLKSGFVAVIDTQTDTVIATIPVGNSPGDVAITPDGRHGYVVNAGSNTVSVINNVKATIPVGNLPSGVAITPDGSRAYVTNTQSDSVSVIDTGSNTVVATISGVQQPQHVAISPDGGRAYITGSGVDVFDTATNTPIDHMGMFIGDPLDVAINPDGSRVYISIPDINDSSSSYVLALDAATNSEIAQIPGDDWPGSVAITPDSSRAYVTNTHDPGGGGEEGGQPEPGPGTVQVINTATNTVTATITVDTPLDVAITPDGSRAYVTDLSSKSVVVIDTATNSITGTIPLGADPNSVAIGRYR